MDKIIITEQEIDRLVAALPKNHHGSIEFDNNTYLITPRIRVNYITYFEDKNMEGNELNEYRKKIFCGRSIMQIKNALTNAGLMDAMCENQAFRTVSSFHLIKHEFDNISMDRTFSMMINLTEKINNMSDQFNILIDVLSLNQQK